ncbi:Trk system potassium transporter TrkA [Dongia soli]|uniref:Trk system potassium uptake protein TrkA n=1 Tax=Dongia soli TaxID=600628 RepID=A0ABU5ECC5_9PROT|nr:Trk system potassium transporter TrkA [Dongia soli]MDY0883083.1 Trk system potassium transporter TrkA [Dongia soli]
MKVVICGAGQVGSSIAKYLAHERNDVTIVDSDQALIREITDQLEVQGIVGHASHPTVLEQAGLRDADLLIAVTASDEVNMMACLIAHSIFDVPTKIARVREQSYLETKWSSIFNPDHLGIDAVISPEIEVAEAIHRRLEVPGAFDAVPLADNLVTLVGVRCTATCPIINTPLRHLTTLFPDLHVSVIGIVRNDVKIIPSDNEMMLPGDDVYFIADTTHLKRALAAFGHEEAEARRLIIVGGGNIGLCLAELLAKRNHGTEVKIIELDNDRAAVVAGRLPNRVVIQGDALDPRILQEANIEGSETIIAVSNDDEVNILASLLAKRAGCQRSVTLINTSNYAPLVGSLGIDAVVSPRATTVSIILQHVRRGRIRGVHSLGDDFGELIEIEVLEASRLAGTSIRAAKLPKGVIIGALVRGKSVIIASGDTVIEPDDRVILFAAPEAVRHVERMFAVRLEFF